MTVPYVHDQREVTFSFLLNVPLMYTLSVELMPWPSPLSGTDKRTTIEFAGFLLVTLTYWPAALSFTALRFEDSAATSLDAPVLRLGPSTWPLVCPSSASYSS